jgi:MoxR-like ATPase
MTLEEVSILSEKLIANIEKVIVGKRHAIETALITLFCRGHLLIEDAPGLGKTMLIRALAGSIKAGFKRIQCTPDLMPADITGVSIYNSDAKDFEFRKGPLFSQFVLVDEINRATPKTQSALLEAMGESQVSVEGTTILLPVPFFVAATQNPIEFEGTFPLPEAQMDRFAVRISIGYPQPEEESEIIIMQNDRHPIHSLAGIIQPDVILSIQNIIHNVFVDPSLRNYIIHIVTATRSDTDCALGASPRGSIFLCKAAQARAAMKGRDFVIPEDIKSLVHEVLAHRIVIRPESRLRNITASAVLTRIMSSIPVPLDDLSKTGASR